MMTLADWNAQVIAEFRANGGVLGGQFEGATVTLLHHRGRKSGRDFVTPLVFQGDDSDPETIYIFASKAGAPTNPDWYHNLIAAGSAEVEVGDETFPVTVEELAGSAREAVFAEQISRMPGFGEYADKVKGVRTIPVLALRRVR